MSPLNLESILESKPSFLSITSNIISNILFVYKSDTLPRQLRYMTILFFLHEEEIVMKHTSNYYLTSKTNPSCRKRKTIPRIAGMLVVAIFVTGTILGILLSRIFIHADTRASLVDTYYEPAYGPVCEPVYEPVTYPANAMILQVPTLSQYPELPTGCEATAATMALNYIGCPTYLETFASLLPRQNLEFRGNEIYGADPNEFFIGDPAKEANSFGCFENVIINTINHNYGNCHAEKAYGSLEDLCAYIQEDVPVLIWATMEMQDVVYRASWILPNGTKFTWPGHEHCMLLVGYDNEMFYFNDPRSGSCVGYDKELSELRYEEMGCRAVIILPY